jgi:hypothetical protein
VLPSSSRSSSPTRGSPNREPENEATMILWNVVKLAVDIALYPSRRLEINSINDRTSDNTERTITDKTIKSTWSFPAFPSNTPTVGLPKILTTYLQHVSSNSGHCGILFPLQKQNYCSYFGGYTVWTLARIVRGKLLYFVSAYISISKRSLY